jgi:hypothetical protein
MGNLTVEQKVREYNRGHQSNQPQCYRARAANDKSLPLLRRPHGHH